MSFFNFLILIVFLILIAGTFIRESKLSVEYWKECFITGISVFSWCKDKISGMFHKENKVTIIERTE